MSIDLTGFDASGYDPTFENYELVSFVVSTTPVLRHDPPIQHWRASALYKHNGELYSTVFDAGTMPGMEFPCNMIVGVTSEKTDMVPEATIRWRYDSFSADKDTSITLKRILELMVFYKMHAFKCDKRGYGCLIWVSGLLIVLEMNGVLPDGSYEEVMKIAENEGLGVPRHAQFIYPGIF